MVEKNYGQLIFPSRSLEMPSSLLFRNTKKGNVH